MIEVVIHHSGETLVVRGNKFRMVLGPQELRSTLFWVRKTGSRILEFNGRGWGHGVGMCQWGSKGMAEMAYGYNDIIRSYFPGCKITRIANYEELEILED